MNTVAELELVRRARSGDVPAFEALYKLYNDRIYNFAKQVTGSADDAADVAQETFVKAWNSLPRLRADGTFGVWLHRIALNQCRDALKNRGRRYASSLDNNPTDADGTPIRMEIESKDPGPEHTLIASESQKAVQQAIESLSADHKLVVIMHHLEGIDVESIAGVLGVPKGTVMSRLSRARETLRRKLAPHVEGDQR